MLDNSSVMKSAHNPDQMNVLIKYGLMEAYESVLRSLCEAGLPEGNVYEFAALKVLKFEKKFKAEQKRRELEKKYHVEKHKHEGGNLLF